MPFWLADAGAASRMSALVLEAPVAETVKSVRLEGATVEVVASSKLDWATAEREVASNATDRRGRCFMVLRDLVVVRLNC